MKEDMSGWVKCQQRGGGTYPITWHSQGATMSLAEAAKYMGFLPPTWKAGDEPLLEGHPLTVAVGKQVRGGYDFRSVGGEKAVERVY